MWFTIDDARKALGENHAQLCYLDRLKSNVYYSPSSNHMSSERHIGSCPAKLAKRQTSEIDDDIDERNQNNQTTNTTDSGR